MRTLSQLQEAAGVAGFAQRADKYQLQSASLATAAAAPLPAGSTAGAGPVSGYGVGGRTVVRDVTTDRLTVVGDVRQLRRETLYKRGSLWVAASALDLDPQRDAAKIQRIARFSEAYFALVQANTPEENEVLAAQTEGTSLLVRFRGQAYLIE